MFREIYPACRRPRESCICPTEPAMVVRTKIVLLTHSKEWRRERCGTGRMTCLNLADAEIIPGVAFDSHPRVCELIDDLANFPVLLYPANDSIDLSESGPGAELAAAASRRQSLKTTRTKPDSSRPSQTCRNTRSRGPSRTASRATSTKGSPDQTARRAIKA